MQAYKIKQVPEDFVVRELPIQKLAAKEKPGYMVFKLKKRNYNTETAVQHLASALHIDRKSIGYAGSKDHNAVTEQYISIRGVAREKAEALRMKDISLEFASFSEEPISLGDLEGNEFEIVVRNITASPKHLAKIINYYGEQRFSTDNAQIGKAIVEKDFKRATGLLLTHASRQEEKVAEALEKSKNDYVGALKRVPWKTLQLYVHAYQSKLWNETAKKYIEEAGMSPEEHIMLPVIGFATETEDALLSRIVETILKEEGIDKQDFIIRQIPDLSSAGTERSLFTRIENFSVGELEDDELNPCMKKALLKFTLGKGSYATEVVKEMFSE